MKKLCLIFLFLILAIGSLSIITYQNVSATSNEIVSHTIKINGTTINGPVVSDGDQFGSSIANIGDLNGDDTPDMIVGAFSEYEGGDKTGAMHVMYMNSNGSVSETRVISAATANVTFSGYLSNFGSSVAHIGNLNDVGIYDIVVGASREDFDIGAIHIIHLSNDTSVYKAIKINNNTINGPVVSIGDRFGSSIANIGDLNGDGISDIAVGAQNDDAGGVDRGAIHVMFMNRNGSVSNTIEINNNTINGPALSDDDRFGSSIANIGDLNGDGVDDIAVGANADRGAIHVMFMNRNGSVSNTIEINNNTINGPALSDDDRFGSSIANIGDLNGDGVDDIAVGAYSTVSSGDNFGSIHVMFMNRNGSVSNTIEINNNTINGPALSDGDRFGSSIANIGDLNGDGVDDIAVGAYSTVSSGDNFGSIHVLFMISTDKTPPTITNITSITTSSGVLKVGDTLSFTLTLALAENGATINGIYNSVPLSWNSIGNGTTHTATYTISEGDADQITPLQITNVTVADRVGNTSLPFDGTDILKTIDANSPQFFSAQTLSISQIVITLDHNVTNSAAIPTDFTLGGVTGGSIGSIVSVSNNIITLGITNATILDSDDVTISYARTSGSFDDVSGNSLLNFAENVANTLDTPPIITLNGDNQQVIELGDGYTELGAITNDGSQVTINATEFTDTIGTYSIYYNSVDASGNRAIQVVRIVNVVDAAIPTFCTVAPSGDWIITTSCTLDSSATATRNVIVQNDSILSIPSGITLNIDFANNNLTVETGSGVLIKSGGTVT